VPSPPADDRLREVQQLLALHGGPAFLRQARRVEEAWRQLISSLVEVRHEYFDRV